MIRKFECIYNRMLLGYFYIEDGDAQILNCSYKALNNILKYLENKNIKLENKYIFNLEELGACCTNCKRVIIFEGILEEMTEIGTKNQDIYKDKNGNVYKMTVDQKLKN